MISKDFVAPTPSNSYQSERVKPISGLSLLFSSESDKVSSKNVLSPSFPGLQRSNSTQINYFEDDEDNKAEDNDFLEQQLLRNQRSLTGNNSSYFKNSFYGSYSGDDDDDYEDYYANVFGVEVLPASSSFNISGSISEKNPEPFLPKPILDSDSMSSKTKASIKDSILSNSKHLFSSEDLLLTIINYVSYRYQEESKSFTDEEFYLLSQDNVIQHLQLLPAEEDGTPMDDLPDFSNCTDVLNLGVTDFVVLERASSVELLHIRISGTIQGDKPFQGSTKPMFSPALIDASGQYDIDSEQDEVEGKDGEEEESMDQFYTLNNDNIRLSDDINADMIQCFRTDTDLQKDFEKDLLKHHQANLLSSVPQITSASLQNVLPLPEDTSNNLLVKPVPPMKSPLQTGRGRSSSGNLLITYRRRGSNRWKVAKELGISPNGSLLPDPSTVITSSIDTKKAIPILSSPVSSQSKHYHPIDLFANSTPIERRHSDRPFDDPEEQLIRKISNTSTGACQERTLSTQSLNPHTSSSFAISFSPKEVPIEENLDEDDHDYINSTRKTSSFMLINNSQKALIIQTLLDANLNIQRASDPSLPINKLEVSTSISPNPSRNNTNVSTISFNSHSTSDNSDEEVIVVETFNDCKSHSNESQSSNHSASSKTMSIPLESSDNIQTTSQNNSRKNSLSSWFQTLWSGTPRRHSSVTSVTSVSSVTPNTTMVPSESNSQRSSSIQQPALPIIQNLDTGDIFPIDVLKYEPFKLPETMSPSVLFENKTNY